MQEKLVSIIMPTYNRQHTICRAIDSVISQSYQNWELIIVDDASVDFTKKEVEQYKDDRIVYFRNDVNEGACISRNIGIRLAKGDYVTFLDSDCAYKKNKIKDQVAEIEKGYDAVYCPFEYYKENECITIPQRDEAYVGDALIEVLREKNIIDTSTILAKCDFIQSIGMFDEEFPALEDYELAIRMVKNGNVGIVKDALVENYYSSISITTNMEKGFRAFLLLYLKHNDLWDYSVLRKKYLDMVKRCVNGYWELDFIFVFEEFVNKRLVLQLPELASELNKMIVKLYHQEVVLFRNLKSKNGDFINKKIQTPFLIYGAGKIANEIYQKLSPAEKENVKYFVITEKKTETGSIEKKEILSIHEMKNRNENKDVFILLAMNRENSVEAIQVLESMGYSNYLYYDNK